jgi:hypothetical protein
VLTLEVPVAEFVEIQKLSDEARRARFDLPETCVPDVSAMKPAVTNSVRLIVLVDCRRAATSPYEPERTRAYKRMQQAGAHYVVDSIAEVPPLLGEINGRLARGERP